MGRFNIIHMAVLEGFNKKILTSYTGKGLNLELLIQESQYYLHPCHII
jgi:hypothetical protein